MNERLKKAKEILKQELNDLKRVEKINENHFSWKFYKHQILYKIWNELFENLPMRDEKNWLEFEDDNYTQWLFDIGGAL